MYKVKCMTKGVSKAVEELDCLVTAFRRAARLYRRRHRHGNDYSDVVVVRVTNNGKYNEIVWRNSDRISDKLTLEEHALIHGLWE